MLHRNKGFRGDKQEKYFLISNISDILYCIHIRFLIKLLCTFFSTFVFNFARFIIVSEIIQSNWYLNSSLPDIMQGLSDLMLQQCWTHLILRCNHAKITWSYATTMLNLVVLWSNAVTTCMLLWQCCNNDEVTYYNTAAMLSLPNLMLLQCWDYLI